MSTYESNTGANVGNLQALTNSITSVASPFRAYLSDLHGKYQSLDEGAIADYIPELALAQPEWFGICVVTAAGQLFDVGNCDQLFTIQSISKAFIFGLALEDHGREYVNSKVSVEPTGEAFNSIVLDEATNRPYNPMVNAGAIATAGQQRYRTPQACAQHVQALYRARSRHQCSGIFVRKSDWISQSSHGLPDAQLRHGQRQH